MSYQISYGKGTKKISISDSKTTLRKSKWKYILVVCGLLVAALFNQRLRYILLPGNPDVTERALIELTSDIQNGEPFSEAITTFCREILDNA